mmetsp:Transcript_9059/g.16408  ORF Transcript_9059/g.16408 Transcript_9059/m.16408 type:complete len:127 (+) Transcript_9059:325-705(+)
MAKDMPAAQQSLSFTFQEQHRSKIMREALGRAKQSCVQNRKEQPPGEYMLIDMGRRLGQTIRGPTGCYVVPLRLRQWRRRTLHLKREGWRQGGRENDEEKPVNQLLLSILPTRTKSSRCLYSRFLA